MIPYEEAKALRETDAFDPRNVRDEFKGVKNDEIINTLNLTKNSLVLMLSNEVRDMNLSSCIRSANSFNIDHVVMTGLKRYDRRGTVGAHHYVYVRPMADRLEAIAEYRTMGYNIVALEHDPNYKMEALRDYRWDSKTVLLAGEEGRSIPSEVLDKCDDIVYIPMFGTVRSLNLASAVSIALYDYDSKVM